MIDIDHGNVQLLVLGVEFGPLEYRMRPLERKLMV